MSEYNPEIKKEMLLGVDQALDQYSEMLIRSYFFGENPEFAEFMEGGPISLPSDRSENTKRIKRALRHTYTKYVKDLLHETHDTVLLNRMAEGNVPAIKVYQPEKIYVDMARCGIEEDAIHAVWLVNTPRRSGYFITDNYGGISEDNNDFISEKSLDRIDSASIPRIEFFEYDQSSGLFLKHEKDTWGGREISGHLAFLGLISVEYPISPKEWFSGVLESLESALTEEVLIL